MRIAATLAMAIAAATLVVGAAQAQTIPHTSHHLGFNAPQMRTHGSGFHRPNRPKYHHQYGHAGYRPVYPLAEAGPGFYGTDG